MNPPCTTDEDSGYAGSEPLDRALADRFAFVLQVPAWSTFTREEQLAVIQARDEPVEAAAAQRLTQLLKRTGVLLSTVQADLGDTAAEYVHGVLPLLLQAGIELSPRRANLLYQAVLAVHAAALALDADARFADNSLLALQSCLPQRAEGLAVPELKLLAAHREAVRSLALSADDPIRAILACADPLERLKLAARSSRLPKGEFSRIAADALAQLPHGAREAAVVHLFETGAVGRLNAAVASQLGEIYRDIAAPPEFSETLHASNSRYRAWGRLKDLLSRLNPKDPTAHLHANAMASLFARKQLQTAEDAEQAFAAYARTDKAVRQP